jgi:hypothetical protein
VKKPWRFTALPLIGCMLFGLWTSPTSPAELKPDTIAAFDHYVQVTEKRMDSDLRSGHFLYLDSLPEEARLSTVAQIRQGELYIEQLHTMEDGMPLRAPSGMIHHWIGVAFIPQASLTQTLNILLDYSKQEEIYKPDIRRSKLLSSDGNTSKTYLQLFKKSMVTVVLNAEFDAEFQRLSDTRAEIRSYSTRIAELRNPGEPDESELPVGNDHGYLWRLNTCWRVEEKDGGVYIQVESVALSRKIPALFAWMIAPTIRKLSWDVIANLLTQTRKAVIKPHEIAGENQK